MTKSRGGLALLLLPLLLVGLLPGQGWAADKVNVASTGLLSDAPFYIAMRKGYFAANGIAPVFTQIDTGPQMVGPLATGQIDVAGGALSAGLYNAVARGVDIKVVADKGSTAPGYDYMPILVRADLVKQGKVHDYADLKGLRFGENGHWGVQASTINEAMKRGGLTYDDAQHVINLPNADHLAAYGNGAIDASVTVEPFATIAVQKGLAVWFSKDLYPEQQIAVLFYGTSFLKRTDVANRFMIAYLQGVRFYNDALADGHFAGPNAQEVIDIIAEDTVLKDKALIAKMIPNANNPDGHVRIDSMRKDLAFLRAEKALDSNITADSVVDSSFVDAALKVLGPYKAKPKS